MINKITLNDIHNKLSYINNLDNTNTNFIVSNDCSDNKLTLNKLTSYITSKVDLSNNVTYDYLNSCSYVNSVFFDDNAIVGLDQTGNDIITTQWSTANYNLIFCNLRTRSNKSIRLYIPPVKMTVGGWTWPGSGLMTNSDKTKLDEYPNYNVINNNINNINTNIKNINNRIDWVDCTTNRIDNNINNINSNIININNNKVDKLDGFGLVADSTLNEINDDISYCKKHVSYYNTFGCSYVIYNFNNLLSLTYESSSSDIVKALRLRYSYNNKTAAEITDSSTIDKILWYNAKTGNHIIDGIRYSLINVNYTSGFYVLTTLRDITYTEIATIGIEYNWPRRASDGKADTTQPRRFAVMAEPQRYDLRKLITSYNVSYNNALEINEIKKTLNDGLILNVTPIV